MKKEVKEIETGSTIGSFIAYVLSPGIGPGLMITFNVTTAILLLCLASMGSVGVAAFHIPFLLFLTFGLLISVNWFYIAKMNSDNGKQKDQTKKDS